MRPLAQRFKCVFQAVCVICTILTQSLVQGEAHAAAFNLKAALVAPPSVTGSKNGRSTVRDPKLQKALRESFAEICM